jgi:bacillopeptidase F (M6 metalloprotease family)
MLKIKLFAIAGVLTLTAIVLAVSPVFVSKAETDTILREIAEYKNWEKVTNKPFSSDMLKKDGAVPLTIDADAGGG